MMKNCPISNIFGELVDHVQGVLQFEDFLDGTIELSFIEAQTLFFCFFNKNIPNNPILKSFVLKHPLAMVCKSYKYF